MVRQTASPNLPIYTVGHSDHSTDEFIALCRDLQDPQTGVHPFQYIAIAAEPAQ